MVNLFDMCFILRYRVSNFLLSVIVASLKIIRRMANEAHKQLLSSVDQVQAKSFAESLILVDKEDKVVGCASKMQCHQWAQIQEHGLLHRAFSLFVFNGKNELLLQQRSHSKITFPGVWSNSCCSHPLNNDVEMELRENLGVRRAAVRRTKFEMGLQPRLEYIQFVTRVLYKAPSCNLWGEHELDHVLITRSEVKPLPNKEEVTDFVYVNREQLENMMNDPSTTFSPWFRLINKSILPTVWKLSAQLPERIIPDLRIHDFTNS